MFGRHCFAVVAIDILCVRTTTDRGERENKKATRLDDEQRKRTKKKAYTNTPSQMREVERSKEKNAQNHINDKQRNGSSKEK